jgi:hypothetical protein
MYTHIHFLFSFKIKIFISYLFRIPEETHSSPGIGDIQHIQDIGEIEGENIQTERIT